MEIRKVAVVGAGNMGSGIAQSWAQAGTTCCMHDVSAEAIERGRSRIEGPLRNRAAAGKMDVAAVDGIMSRLTAEAEFAKAVGDADLVVEAVFEDLGVKRDLFARLDAACAPGTVFATNTSSLRVADLASATQRPDRVVGLHYFFPAAINKLVEVVRTPATSDEAFATVFTAAKAAGKIPIETADSPGFCVNRFFVPWINEACRILDEGIADIPTIEAAAKEAFGIGMGPFELMNVTGVPISLHAQRTLHDAFGAFYEPSAALVRQVEAKADWDLSGDPEPGHADTVAARLRGVAFGIACHLVAEGVATMRDTDRGATIGLRWAKGPFAMMNALGLDHALAEVRALHDQWGDAFPVPKELARLAGAGEAWHLPAVVHEHAEDGIVVVTFDRPEALNALDQGVLSDLEEIVEELQAETPRVVVVTGSGRAFVAGADIPTMKALDADAARDYTRFGNKVLNRLADLPCPVIMAVNGHCLGGGLELALCGDLLYASDKATLGLPEVGLGIHPGFGGTQRLPRRVGLGAAKELVYTGRVLSADEAAHIGLVNAVWPHTEFMGRVLEVARTIREKAPLAVQGAKRSIDEGTGVGLDGGLEAEQESVVLLFSTKDKDEGLSAFLERRKPVFTGQ